ncbi:chemotaxis protein CheW [Mitsuaria sp. GD03876]|uniref:chemotaxis protein CheW n=1 Tax=Mitsuaria sp. GD03876 TaxID=2975399 RepID=UPI00244B3821|nr:chemotaxis protein CheW [Mitsuaria sp. GD03876]MDH0866909.1 chemotaxis protein CheW [Mitsuaria sp. GD03876]
MHKPSNGVVRVLVCRVHSRLCGLPLDAVEETLRPQPLRPLAAPVAHVAGLARIRGDWLPVVDLAAALGMSAADPAAPVRRFVVLRVGERRVALAVGEVLGLHELPAADLRALPPLLRDREHGAIAALAERDDELVALLDQGRLLPDGTLAELALSTSAHGDAGPAASRTAP